MTLHPQLVIDECGKMNMQVKLGQYTATMPLHEGMASFTAQECKDFFDRVVPEMTLRLHAMKRDHERKLRRKACSGSIDSHQDSPAGTLTVLPGKSS